MYCKKVDEAKLILTTQWSAEPETIHVQRDRPVIRLLLFVHRQTIFGEQCDGAQYPNKADVITG